LTFYFRISTNGNPKEQSLLGRYFSCNDYTDLLFAVLVLSTGANNFSGVVEVGFSARPGLGQECPQRRELLACSHKKMQHSYVTLNMQNQGIPLK
jgi:hypothetical protein